MIQQSKLIFPYGVAQLEGKLKQKLEDFQVFEELGFEPSGEGEHLYLYIEKEDTTTDTVTQNLARHYGVKPYHISSCGLKDAKAVTRQWFSVHLPKEKEFPTDPEAEDYKILKKSWSLKKLKKGVHKGNRFNIKLSKIHGDIEYATEQIEQVKQYGFANYFGEQRFGKGKKNVPNALDAFKYNKKLSRSKRSLYLSSLRSFLFNEVLQYRINNTDWMQLIEGDCFMLDGTRSTFCEAINDEILQRYLEGDIHPIISLMGEGEALNSALALALENQVTQPFGEIVETLIQQGLTRDKRSMRQNLRDFEYQFKDDDLELSFVLPKGCYATSVIQHFCLY